ncbi:hypothetical protein GJAV_G00245130 [Gymnothorax javanicus]|nr:hypothetical protein GJAV_G00245130 [Gymnothorax javanicus]
MGWLRSLELGVVLLLSQVLGSGFCEEAVPCQPSFGSEVFVFTAHRWQLHRGRPLGKVRFDDCGDPQRVLFSAKNSSLRVDCDGTVVLKRALVLHSGERNFTVSILGSKSERKSATVTVQLVHSSKHGHHSHHHGTGQHLQHHQKRHDVESELSEDSKNLPVLVFPPSTSGLKRRKRDWVIPPINFPENQKGPFPMPMVQIRSSRDSEVKIQYSISGPGATEDPVGIFTIDKGSGWLSVTQPLDREKQAKYVLLAHAKALGTSSGRAEDPMEIVINVIDQNDNKPTFTKDTYTGSVAESSPIGFEFMKVKAVDLDEPGNANADVRYKILSQDPESPKAGMFFINPTTGGIQVQSLGLDREKFPKYTLIIQAADMEGEGLVNSCTAIISVTDSNDNAPEFKQNSYTVSVPENEVGYTVVKMPVTDGDEPHTPAWEATFKIIEGDKGGFFNVSTGPSKQEGIITTIKGLDFEKNALYTLLVTVENVAPFATRLPTSTATVVVNVEDQNEAPIFNPVQKLVSEPENLEVGAEITSYTATDPDTAKKQKVWYKTGRDPAGWLNVNKDTGLITVRSPMDRESVFMKDGKYEALILGIDDADIPATGTGTLLIELQDVNDNAPTIGERTITMCNQDPQPVTLSVSDKDGQGFGAPFRVDLQGSSENNWTADMNATQTGIVLGLKTYLEQNDYNVVLRVYDVQGMYQDSSILAKVCDCKGTDTSCNAKAVAGVGLPGILGILGAILLLLCYPPHWL